MLFFVIASPAIERFAPPRPGPEITMRSLVLLADGKDRTLKGSG